MKLWDKIFSPDLKIVQSFDSNAFGDGAVLGCDFVGTVEASGNNVSRARLGDTVAGLIWGGKNSV